MLAELHFKLAREHPTAKMEKMWVDATACNVARRYGQRLRLPRCSRVLGLMYRVQDWEKTLARKLQENWRKEFTANPMAGGVTYRELTVFQRVGGGS